MRFLDWILLAIAALALMQVYYKPRKARLVKPRQIEPERPPRDYSNYVCPVCGEKGYTFVRCYRAGCADGR